MLLVVALSTALIVCLASTKMTHAKLDLRLVPVGSIKTVGHRLAARVARLANIKAPLDRLDVIAADQVSFFLPSFDSYRSISILTIHRSLI